jgi:hypothetical protein
MLSPAQAAASAPDKGIPDALTPEESTRCKKTQHTVSTPRASAPGLNETERSRGPRSCSSSSFSHSPALYPNPYGMRNMSKIYTQISEDLQRWEQSPPRLHCFERARIYPCHQSRIENRREQRQASENDPHTSSASGYQLIRRESIRCTKRTK